MKNQELFHKTIGILVNAYLNDTLKPGLCHACVVGNLISHRRTFSKLEIENLNHQKSGWVNVFCTITYSLIKKQTFIIENYIGIAKEQIDLTEYTPYELAKLEYAFEMVDHNVSMHELIFEGLMSVCEALMEIHEANESEIKEAKSLFVKELTD